MSKMKVSELSAEINKKSKEIVDFLKANGYDNVKNMNSVLSDEEEKAARMEFAPETIKKEKPKAKAEPKPKKVKAAPVEKQIEQTFDGRSPEVREAAERKAKKASVESEAKKAASKEEAAPKTKKAKEAPAKEAETTSASSVETVAVEKETKAKETKSKETKAKEHKKETKEPRDSETKEAESAKAPETRSLTPEEAAIEFARKKASQAAALSPKGGAQSSGNKSQKFGDRKRGDKPQGSRDTSKDGNRDNRQRQGDGQNRNGEGFRGNRNSDRPQSSRGDKPFNKDGNASVIFSYTDANTFLDFAKFSQDNTVKVESIQVMSLEEAKSQGQLDGIDTSQINSSANVVAIKGIADVTTQGSILAAASDGKQLNHEEKEVVTEGEMSYIVVNNK